MTYIVGTTAVLAVLASLRVRESRYYGRIYSDTH